MAGKKKGADKGKTAKEPMKNKGPKKSRITLRTPHMMVRKN